MPRQVLIQLTKTKHKERTLKASGKKQQVTYKGNPMYLPTYLSAETLQARRECQDIFKVLKEENLQPRLSCSKDYSIQQGSHSKLMEK